MEPNSLCLPVSVYEYLATEVAYGSYDRGSAVSYTDADGVTYAFKVTAVFSFASGYRGYGLTLMNGDDEGSLTVLASQGTQNLRDVLDDLNSDGIGIFNFRWCAADVLKWAREELEQGRSLSFTGHSLGGAMSQYFAAYFSDELGVTLADLVTFNSPGIAASYGGYDFTRADLENVRHYVCAGDVVSMAGAYFVPGQVYYCGNDHVFCSETTEKTSAKEYMLHQHSSGKFEYEAAEKERNFLLRVLNADFFADGAYSDLAVTVDAIPEDLLKTTVQAVDFGGEAYLFNAEFAEMILAINDLDLSGANNYVSRADVEYDRTDRRWSTLWKLMFYNANTNVTITIQSAYKSAGADYALLTCGEFGQLIFNFTGSEFSLPSSAVSGNGVLQWSGADAPATVTVNFANGRAASYTTGNHRVSVYGAPENYFTYQCFSADAVIDEGVAAAATLRTAEPQVVAAEENGADDLLFAAPSGVWEMPYMAVNAGSVGAWRGTGEMLFVVGKNRFPDLFRGAENDKAVLFLTDDANGDAVFLDDVYTSSPNDAAQTSARLADLNEIFAGAGDDVVDLTSGSFEWSGGGVTIHGGDGDDVIWANSGRNLIFGDAGNDRLVGGAGDDILVGGAGDDSLHGGGGADTFVFCENWGWDTVYQTASGTVLLWFAADFGTWDEAERSYSDGANFVKVCGDAEVTLKFGDDGSEEYDYLLSVGAFAPATATANYGSHYYTVVA